MAWEPITGLGDGWEELASRELPPLIAVWSEQRESLLETESLKDFNERLAREWAIETGILEGLYTLDRGITRLLIERGIDESLISHDATDRPPAQVAAHIHDQKDAIDWLFEFVKSERPFSESFIKELHALITRSQDTATGIASGRKVEVPLLRGAAPTRSGPTIRLERTVLCTITVILNRSRSRWNVSSSSMIVTARRASRRRCSRPGCTIASCRSIPSRTETAALPGH